MVLMLVVLTIVLLGVPLKVSPLVGPQPLPPHAPVPALVRSLILGNVSQPSKIASLIAFLVILRQVQTFVNLSKMAVGI